MEVAETPSGAPPWELYHRLARALEWAHVSADDMVAELGVSRNTVYNYAGGRSRPSRAVVRVWALRCGVPFEWLLTGHEPEDNPEASHTIRYLTAA